MRQAEGENFKASVFTDKRAFPPDVNSFHVPSLPTRTYTNVYGGRLSHLIMSFPQLSLTVVQKSNMVSEVMGVLVVLL